MKLCEIDKFFNDIREANKLILKSVVSDDETQKSEDQDYIDLDAAVSDDETQKSDNQDNLGKAEFVYCKQRRYLAESEKEWVEKLLRDDELLQIFLDSEVRGIIIGIVNTLSKISCCEKKCVLL